VLLFALAHATRLVLDTRIGSSASRGFTLEEDRHECEQSDFIYLISSSNIALIFQPSPSRTTGN
jgi:hypothetical protein